MANRKTHRDDWPARKLADFEGAFRLVRHITHVDAAPATFTGTATWSPDKDGLRYFEAGLLAIRGHHPMASERRYFWGPDLNVYFDDGRFFHQVPASGGSTSHWCDPDRYTASYHFNDWPNFQVVWRVKGPNKNYRMVSHYTRTD